MAGESRMSSVLGLKVRPSTATVLPRASPPQRGDDLARHRALAVVVDRHHGLDDALRRVVILRCLDQRERILGKARAAIAGTGMQELCADAVVEPDATRTSCTSAPTFSQRSAISLMKVILVARKALAAYLVNSAVAAAR